MGWQDLVAVGRRQAGVVSLRQVVAAGVPERTFRDWVARLRLERPTRSAALLPGADPTRPETRVWVALCTVGSPVWLSGLSTVALAGATRWPATVDVVVPRHRRPSGPTGVRVRRTDVTPDEVRAARGIPVLRPAHALREVAALESHREALAAVAATVRHGAARPSEVDAAAVGRRRGAAQLRTIATQLADTGARSVLAHEVTLLLQQAGWRTRPEVPVRRLDGRAAYLDIGIVGTRVAIEADGIAWHDRAPARSRDRVRDNQLAATGITVLHVDWPRLSGDPDGFLAEVAAAVARG